MSEALRGLQPVKLWELFGQIAGVPHGSQNEKALAVHLRSIAKRAGLSVEEDGAGNTCIAAPALKGYEDAPTVVLQGHLDMVCEKNKERTFDYSREAIHLVRDGDWIRADGTTLGADNGIGVAAALGVVLTPDIIHGPLEVLLTVNEETGLVGAANLSPSLVQGRILLNLDSEKTGSVCIGCAGGGSIESILMLDLVDRPDDTTCLEIRLAGLRGGHSGIDILDNRGNGVKITARTVASLNKLGATLTDFQSGDKPNAIPREGFAGIVLPRGNIPQALEIISEQATSFRAEFENEPALQITTQQIVPPPRVLSKSSTARALNLLLGFPNGVLAMSRDMEGLVETSNNLSSAHVNGDLLFIHNTPRSSRKEALDSTTAQIAAVSELAGASSKLKDPYPGWQPDIRSEILRLFEETYTEMFGTRPTRVATHAGLECGVIGQRCAGMDMISFGPTIANAHSPDEAVSIKSVETFWKLLVELLGNIAKGGYRKNC